MADDGGGKRTKKSARSKARKRALDVLFEADLRSVSSADVLESLEARSSGPLNPHTRVIVEGVAAHADRIDDLISTYAAGWTLDRMPAVDRNVLRIGTWEILWGDAPEGVAISEAVELVTELSTDESAGFVNGVLAQIAEIKPHLVLDP